LGLIPTRELSQRELVRRLKELVDSVLDPEYRIKHPEAFAKDYHCIVMIVSRQKTQLHTKYVSHNLGQARLQFLDALEIEAGAA
jgi:hypothetical protein